MPEFELDKWKLSDLHGYQKAGRLTLKPPYQRGRAWSDDMRIALVDTVVRDFPMGVILLDESKDADGRSVWDTIDGQQRCTTLIEYLDGVQPWTQQQAPPGSDFTSFSALTPSQQERFRDYQVAVAKLRGYANEDIREIFVRIQYGKALSGGEKIKAINSPYKGFIEQLVASKVFSDWPNFQYRDGHWAMAGEFFQGFYNQRPLERREYRLLEKFVRDKDKFNQQAATRAVNSGRWILNYANRVLHDCDQQSVGFRKQINGRLLKWLVASLTILKSEFAISGREPDVASAVVDYWSAKDDPNQSAEYEAYFHTLRSGRIDTDEVKACLEQLMNRMVLRANLPPTDPKRFFTPQQRKAILAASGGVCQGLVAGQACGATLSATNFHADHIIPHSVGGATDIANGQALCSGCNLRKGKASALAELFLL